jgi:hypothetical protein
MDRKVFGMAMLTIISAFILILVIIYATNADKINDLLGNKKKTAEDNSSAEISFVPEAEYGQQIGDDLKSFLYDDDFFDEPEKIPSVVVIQKNTKTVDSAAKASDSSEGVSEDEETEDEEEGFGGAVVGQLDNPDAATSLSTFPNGIFPIEGPISGSETIGGTPVGTVP